VSSSYYTYQHWIGFIGYLLHSELKQSLSNTKPFMLSSLKTGKSSDSGICSARWASDDTFLIGTDNGIV